MNHSNCITVACCFCAMCVSLPPSFPSRPPFPLSSSPPLTHASSSPPFPLYTALPLPYSSTLHPPLPFPPSCPTLPSPLPSPRPWMRGWLGRSGKQRHFIIFNKINSRGECCFCVLSFHNDRQTLLFFLSEWRMEGSSKSREGALSERPKEMII